MTSFKVSIAAIAALLAAGSAQATAINDNFFGGWALDQAHSQNSANCSTSVRIDHATGLQNLDPLTVLVSYIETTFSVQETWISGQQKVGKAKVIVALSDESISQTTYQHRFLGSKLVQKKTFTLVNDGKGLEERTTNTKGVLTQTCDFVLASY